ncbi:murein transglycosylase A [Sulfurimonas marina]|uniref:peptidoglycan lytic exotransglycosylase n=1 Tax=Sulfurimonas marina TaxID=2590551 RepID=A0A7M1AVZ2_9BACT|nr:murein transglycosylase A [Sulfurimonas marina]QOP41585.1 transglycosylase [Sulfurimonas marina]
MKRTIVLIFIATLFLGCSQKNLKQETKIMQKSNYSALPESFKDEDFQNVLELFQENCQSKRTLKIYPGLCEKSLDVEDPKTFILQNFQPYQLNNEKGEGLLTGYYLASINASLEKTDIYKYPVYKTPVDLVSVNLSEIYPELKHYRLRGRLVDGKVIPYYSRAEAENIEAPVLCYCDSKVDKFFLEIQGSGKVYLDDNTTMYIGYDNQNGRKYKAIGRYLVAQGEMRIEDVSMQSIRAWLEAHPKRIDEVLNYNDSMVFFRKKAKGAYGALGLKLTPMRSVAVDRKYIKLGSMLYLDADLEDRKISKIVFAQDTGGAIKGSVRADFFTGFGKEAEELAGKLKAPLKLWVFLPKEENKERDE